LELIRTNKKKLFSFTKLLYLKKETKCCQNNCRSAEKGVCEKFQKYPFCESFSQNLRKTKTYCSLQKRFCEKVIFLANYHGTKFRFTVCSHLPKRIEIPLCLAGHLVHGTRDPHLQVKISK
jgi:hypothetical protein